MKPDSSYKRHGRAIYRTARWKALRQQALRRDGFQCVQCGARGRLEVDHIRPIRDHPELAYSLGNLQCLCAACHTKKTRHDIGLPEPSPERLKWKAAVRELMR